MKALLVRPWQECVNQLPHKTPPLLIVVDALDEIEHGGGYIFLRDLLQAIRDGHLSGLKFLVTSRPDPDIVALCSSFPQHAVCRLQEVDMTIVDQDITTFLRAKLPALADEPQLVELARRSSGLFIYAATAVRYSNPRPRMSKFEQLGLIGELLRPTWPVNSRNLFLIDELYKQILWSAFSGLEDEQFATRRLLLHDILSAGEHTWSASTIAQKNSTTEEMVQLVVTELHSVLYIKDNRICWYHASFPDFIFDSARSKFIVELPGSRQCLIDMSCAQERNKLSSELVNSILS
jgi:hypothetical protein